MKYIEKFNEGNIISFENYLILESRKEDLLQKFKKEFGEGLGEIVFNLDPTDNKAYGDWLFKFFKNNREEIGIGDSLSKSIGDSLTQKLTDEDWKNRQLDGKKLDIIRYMLKKYDNNKKDFSTPITEIKTLEQLRKTIDEKDNFDEIENYPENEVKVYHNGLEWIVFQPFTYEISQYANRKDREKNWCTTYGEGHFHSYLGEKGGLLYCTNKLNSRQDLAFQLRPNETIIPWNSKDNSRDIIYSFYDMKEEFDEDSEIYKILDEVEHEIDFPQIDKSQLKEEVYDFYFDSLSFDEIYLDKDIYLEILNDSNFLEDYIESQIEYYSDEFTTDFLPTFDSELDETFKYIWKNVGGIKFTDYFGFKKIGFWKPEGYPDIDDFIEALEEPERLKNQDYAEDTTYNREECYEQIEDFLDKYDKTEDFVRSVFTNQYEDYKAEDLIGEMYGDPYKMKNKELTDIGGNYIGYSDYLKAYVNSLSVDEMMEIAYPE